MEKFVDLAAVLKSSPTKAALGSDFFEYLDSRRSKLKKSELEVIAAWMTSITDLATARMAVSCVTATHNPDIRRAFLSLLDGRFDHHTARERDQFLAFTCRHLADKWDDANFDDYVSVFERTNWDPWCAILVEKLGTSDHPKAGDLLVRVLERTYDRASQVGLVNMSLTSCEQKNVPETVPYLRWIARYDGYAGFRERAAAVLRKWDYRLDGPTAGSTRGLGALALVDTSQALTEDDICAQLADVGVHVPGLWALAGTAELPVAATNVLLQALALVREAELACSVAAALTVPSDGSDGVEVVRGLFDGFYRDYERTSPDQPMPWWYLGQAIALRWDENYLDEVIDLISNEHYLWALAPLIAGYVRFSNHLQKPLLNRLHHDALDAKSSRPAARYTAAAVAGHPRHEDTLGTYRKSIGAAETSGSVYLTLDVQHEYRAVGAFFRDSWVPDGLRVDYDLPVVDGVLDGDQVVACLRECVDPAVTCVADLASCAVSGAQVAGCVGRVLPAVHDPVVVCELLEVMAGIPAPDVVHGVDGVLQVLAGPLESHWEGVVDRLWAVGAVVLAAGFDELLLDRYRAVVRQHPRFVVWCGPLLGQLGRCKHPEVGLTFSVFSGVVWAENLSGEVVAELVKASRKRKCWSLAGFMQWLVESSADRGVVRLAKGWLAAAEKDRAATRPVMVDVAGGAYGVDAGTSSRTWWALAGGHGSVRKPVVVVRAGQVWTNAAGVKVLQRFTPGVEWVKKPGKGPGWWFSDVLPVVAECAPAGWDHVASSPVGVVWSGHVVDVLVDAGVVGTRFVPVEESVSGGDAVSGGEGVSGGVVETAMVDLADGVVSWECADGVGGELFQVMDAPRDEIVDLSLYEDLWGEYELKTKLDPAKWSLVLDGQPLFWPEGVMGVRQRGELPVELWPPVTDVFSCAGGLAFTDRGRAVVEDVFAGCGEWCEVYVGPPVGLRDEVLLAEFEEKLSRVAGHDGSVRVWLFNVTAVVDGLVEGPVERGVLVEGACVDRLVVPGEGVFLVPQSCGGQVLFVAGRAAGVLGGLSGVECVPVI